MDDRVIARLAELGVTLFRINLSHTELKDVASIIRYIKERTDVPVCLDTEGAQIRTGAFVEDSVVFRENTVIRAHVHRVPGDAKDFNFYPANIIDQFEVGALISIDFNLVLVQVVGREGRTVLMRVLNGGTLGKNKAVSVDHDIPMPSLTEKDKEALRIGVGMGLTHYALSFTNHRSDVDEIRSIIGNDAFIISKIESRDGIINLDTIAAKSDAILIDRGDLSRQIPIEQIPRCQKEIIRRAKRHGCKVYVATNLLESMVNAPTPTRAEVNDIYSSLMDGANGLVLAAETAIGSYPIQCATMIVRIKNGFEKQEEDDEFLHPIEPISLLVEPHGGKLVNRTARPSDLRDIDRLTKLVVAKTAFLDCEQISCGTYSPLTGFMDSATLSSVLNECRLPEGPIWTLPIVLQARDDAIKNFGPDERIALVSGTGQIQALLDVSEVFRFDFKEIALQWFGTDHLSHPGVARLARQGNYFVAGAVTLVKRLPSARRHYEMSPSQTRFIFSYKGWGRVVGFHTRNPPHRIHEYIQLNALEQTEADGLYINPVTGPKRAGDFLPGPIMKSYQTLLEFGIYPSGKVVLGGFATYSRYCGPREAVFTALCRKNMGCSHFIVGRDHTGLPDYYAPDSNEKMFDRLGDIGVTPIFFEAIGFDRETGSYRGVSEAEYLEPINGTRIRESLRRGTRLPDWIMRDIVQDVLFAEIATGRPIFTE